MQVVGGPGQESKAPCCQPSAGSTSYRPAATVLMLSLLGKVAGKDFTQGRASVLLAMKQTQSPLLSPLLVLDISLSFVLQLLTLLCGALASPGSGGKVASRRGSWKGGT